MQTVEFETNIINGVITVPEQYKDLHDVSAKVTLTVENSPAEDIEPDIIENIEISASKELEINLNQNSQALDLSNCNVTCFKDVNPVEYQRKIRDAR